MLESEDIYLDKAKLSDWLAMYRNVWSQPESARYMAWRVTDSEDKAQMRMRRTIEFQQDHDSFLVYEKASGEAIGFVGVEKLDDGSCRENGICLGPRFTGKGYGKQIVTVLMRFCREELGAAQFMYSAREQNEAANGLARSLGFQLIGTEEKTDERDGRRYVLLQYSVKL